MKRRSFIRYPSLTRGLLPCCWAAVSLLATGFAGGCNSRSVEQLLGSFSRAASTPRPASSTSDDVAVCEGDAAASAPVGDLRQQCRDELQRHQHYAFDFDLTSLEGRRLRLGQFAGRVLIVDVWATWCPPCRSEIPHFVELHHRYGEDGLAILGINYERASTDNQAKQKIEAFMQRQAIPYPLALGTESLKDQIPDFRGYPTTLMIDRSGRVRATLVGARSLEYLETMASLLMDESYDGPRGDTATDGPSSLPAAPRIQLNPFAADHAPHDASSP